MVDAIKNGGIQLVFNTTEGAGALSDSRSLRRAALLHKVPYYTTLAGAMAAGRGHQGLPRRRSQGPPVAGIFRGLILRAHNSVPGPEGAECSPPGLFIVARDESIDKVPITTRGYAALEEELKHRQQVERQRIIQANCRGTRPRRPLRERRVSRRQGSPVPQRGPGDGAREHDRPGRDHRRLEAVRRQDQVRRHREARSTRTRKRRRPTRSSASRRPTCAPGASRSARLSPVP